MLVVGVEVPVCELNVPVVREVLVKAKVFPEVAAALNKKEASPSRTSSAVK